MSSGHSQHDEAGHQHEAHHGPRTLPASLAAPEEVKAWRTRALIVFAVFTLLSLGVFAISGFDSAHILRAYLMGFMTCFNLAGGALALLMVQYVTGGKWGLLLRRPLEAMAGTLPLVAVLFLPILFFMKSLYQWAKFDTPALRAQAVSSGAMSKEQALTANAKTAMLSPAHFTIEAVIVFVVLLSLAFLLRKWSLERDSDPNAGTAASYDYWRVKFENLSGPSIFVYVVLLTVAAIGWIMSLDVTWYSSIWGLQFLVAQGYGVLALSIITVIRLSKVEPLKTLLRTTEQHDLGKFLFAFVMLNIYLCFAEFLIIWSGNVPDEIPWYLNRIHGGWWTICTLDFVCHWLIPFCLLLSRDLKRNKTKMTILCSFMILARLIDMFWLIEPNFSDAAGNLHLAGNLGILAYVTVPVAILALWGSFYLTRLMQRPLVNVNDPHLEEMLEPEHAH